MGWLLVYEIEEGGYILLHKKTEGRDLKEAYRVNLRLNQLQKLRSVRIVVRDIHTRLGIPYKKKDTVERLFARLESIYREGVIFTSKI